MNLVDQQIRRVVTRARQVLARIGGSELALRAETRRVLRDAYRAGLIRTVFDIGAHKGRWAASMKRLMPEARFVLFEANPIHVPDLARSGFEYYVAVLSRPGVSEVAFWSLPDDVGSTGGSAYKEKTPQYKRVEAVKLPAAALSALVMEHNLPCPDLVKIDTQGAELDVIAGGRGAIAQANYLLIEVPVIEYNRGAPKLEAYLRALEDLGFLPATVSEIHTFGPVLIQLDLLFVSRRRVGARVLTALQL